MKIKKLLKSPNLPLVVALIVLFVYSAFLQVQNVFLNRKFKALVKIADARNSKVEKLTNRMDNNATATEFNYEAVALTVEELVNEQAYLDRVVANINENIEIYNSNWSAQWQWNDGISYQISSIWSVLSH